MHIMPEHMQSGREIWPLHELAQRATVQSRFAKVETVLFCEQTHVEKNFQPNPLAIGYHPTASGFLWPRSCVACRVLRIRVTATASRVECVWRVCSCNGIHRFHFFLASHVLCVFQPIRLHVLYSVLHPQANLEVDTVNRQQLFPAHNLICLKRCLCSLLPSHLVLTTAKKNI